MRGDNAFQFKMIAVSLYYSPLFMNGIEPVVGIRIQIGQNHTEMKVNVGILMFLCKRQGFIRTGVPQLIVRRIILCGLVWIARHIAFLIVQVVHPREVQRFSQSSCRFCRLYISYLLAVVLPHEMNKEIH